MLKKVKMFCFARFGLKRGVGYTFAKMVTSAGEGARFQFASDQSLLVYFDQPKKKGRARARLLQSQITLHAHRRVRKLLRRPGLEPPARLPHLHPHSFSLPCNFDAPPFVHT